MVSEGFIVLFFIGFIVWWFSKKQPDELPEPTPMQNILKPLVRYEITIKTTQKRELTPLELAMKPFSLNVDAKPTYKNHIEYIDHITGEIYQVYLLEQTCTCDEFKLRKGESKNNLRRWCTHIMQSMYSDDALDESNDWIKAIVRDGHHGPLAAWLVNRSSAGPFLLTIGKNTDWINIYPRTKRSNERISDASGEIDRFGWKIREKEWAYGVPPPGSRELRKLVSVITSITINQLQY